MENADVPAEIDLLMVEDCESDVILAIRELRHHKSAHRVQVIGDGEQALDFLFCRGVYRDRSFRRPPKVIWLGMDLPKVDGLEVLKTIKSDARTRAIPVVIMSESCEPEDLRESYRLGVNAFIRKPVDCHNFRQAIEWALGFWLTLNLPPPVLAFAT